MDCVNSVNQLVNVVAYYFRGLTQPECYPKRMEYNNQIVTFDETGSRRTSLKGRRLVHVFDMTDGQADYRLEFNAETLSWALVSINSSRSDSAGITAKVRLATVNSLA